MRDQIKSSRPAKNSSGATSVPYPYSHLTKSEIVRLFHLEDIQEPLTPREFTRYAIAVVSRWCDNVLTGRYSSVESVGSKLDCLERSTRTDKINDHGFIRIEARASLEESGRLFLVHVV